jgi:tetratricopeptide (TPR) repeat protein
MGLDRSQRLTRGAAPDGIELTPEEYFVLSRVEGTPTVGEIIVTSGLAAPDAARILDKLLEVGAVVTTNAVPEPPARAPKRLDSSLRGKVADRRRKLLVAQFGARADPSVRPSEAQPIPRAIVEDADIEVGEEIVFDRVDRPKVGNDDPRLDPAVEIAIEDQRQILGLADAMDDLSQFEFLGLQPTHELRAIKRAFHETSRRLHPDSYYGRELGPFREILAELFRRAKLSYAELRDPEVRTPWVDHHITEKAHLRRLEEEAEERERAALDRRRQANEAEAAMRRAHRAQDRARRRRERLQERMLAQADRYRVDAEEAEQKGNDARAANLYRLALRADPHNPLYEAKWQQTRHRARKTRAADAFAKAQSFLELGKSEDAMPLLVEAAEADPTAEHLAFAADAIKVKDHVRARDLALAALDALGVSEAKANADKTVTRRKAAWLGQLHLMIGRAFLAAGQKQTAKQQALIAERYCPDDMEVRALLKACKAK